MMKASTIATAAICALALAAGCRYPVVNSRPSSAYSFKEQKTLTTSGASHMQNKNFCRPSEDSKSIVFAPVILPPKTSAPTEWEYNDAGWFRNAVQPPSPPEGKVLSDTTYRYDEEENAVVADYTYVDAPPPTLEEFDAAMEDFLRQEREERGYTTREPDSYLTSNVPRWAADARDWVNHRDAVMEYALDLINAVKRGEREPPTMEEFLANMPRIQWTYNLSE